jgi:dephospho-CoA kinase
MWRIGVTGSIATGKSTILHAFADNAVPVFSADAAVAELYTGDAVHQVEALFPGTLRDGAIDRAVLSQRLAENTEGFKKLEALIHPLVREKIAEFLQRAEARGEALAVVEVPLLFEAGNDYGFDAIAVTHVDPAIQRARALARPGMTGEKLETILARQLPQDEKIKRADVLFDTGVSVDQTRQKVTELVADIRSGKLKKP